MVSVVLRDGEDQRRLVGRFRKKVVRSGVLGEVRKRRWYLSRSERRRIEKQKAIRRYKKNKGKYNNRYRNR